MITAEKIKKRYDKYAQNYDADTDLQQGLADKLVAAIPKLPLRILDIGCGTGYLLKKMGTVPSRQPDSRRDCPHFLGCDISFGMLSCARDKGGHYVQSEASVLPFADSSFDIIVSNAAYQWIRDLKTAFSEARRVLKPDGKFYFTIFNKNTLWQLQKVCEGFNIASGGFPDKDILFLSLQEAGFKIDSVETFRYEKYYKDLWQLLCILKNIGCASAENNIKGLNWRAILKKANDLYRAEFANENGIPATYEAFLVKAEEGTLSHD